MSMRPNLYEMIGVDVAKIEKGEEWLREFQKTQLEKDFLILAENALYLADDDVEFIEEYIVSCEKLSVQDMFQLFSRNGQLIAGVLPIYDMKQHQLYGHDLLYSLLETSLLPNEPQIHVLPYTDFSAYIGKTKEELKETRLSLKEKQAIVHYEGQWGRKYEHHSLDWFDRELEFTYHFFRDNGLLVDKKDIQRYLVFEWN